MSPKISGFNSFCGKRSFRVILVGKKLAENLLSGIVIKCPQNCSIVYLHHESLSIFCLFFHPTKPDQFDNCTQGLLFRIFVRLCATFSLAESAVVVSLDTVCIRYIGDDIVRMNDRRDRLISSSFANVSDTSSMAVFRNVNVFLVLRLAGRERRKERRRTTLLPGRGRSAYESQIAT